MRSEIIVGCWWLWRTRERKKKDVCVFRGGIFLPRVTRVRHQAQSRMGIRHPVTNREETASERARFQIPNSLLVQSRLGRVRKN